MIKERKVAETPTRGKTVIHGGAIALILLDIPGKGTIKIREIVFDYNGTLAVDGLLPDHVAEQLKWLAQKANVTVLTADTFGTATAELQKTGVNVYRFPSDEAGLSKKTYVMKHNPAEMMTIGNGYNDIQMSRISALSIAVIGDEGCSGKLIGSVDLVVKDIMTVFELLRFPDRIKATLRH